VDAGSTAPYLAAMLVRTGGSLVSFGRGGDLEEVTDIAYY
jgi:hypothetical protein